MRLSCRTRVDIQAADVLSAISPMSAVATPTPGVMIFIGRPLALILRLGSVHAAIRPRKATRSGNSELRARQAHHGCRGQGSNPLASPGKTEAFRGGGLKAHALRLDADELGQARAHAVPVGANARGLADDGDIDVHHVRRLAAHALYRLAQKKMRGGAFPARIAIGEKLTDVAFPHRPEQGV